jgi:putative NADH-flavin reductase
VRPPRLVDEPLTGHYRTVLGANVARGSAIARADVAHAMLDALAAPQTIRQPVGVAY